MRVEIKGDKKLIAHLKKCQDLTPIKKIVQVNGDEMNRNMKKETQTAFTKGYTQGTTARSINTVIKDGGLTAMVGPTTEYAKYVEYGTRFMEPEPFIGPAFEKQKDKFINDLERVCD